MTRLIFIVLVFASAIYLHAQNSQSVLNSISKTEITFRENKGQVSDQFFKHRQDVLFSGTDGNCVFHLKSDGISYQLLHSDTLPFQNETIPRCFNASKQDVQSPLKNTIYRLDVNWLNTNHQINILKSEESQAYDNFYSESCPNGALEVKSYGKIIYQNIYNGIDLVWRGSEGKLKYDYLVSAFADYTLIKFELKGADKISIAGDGALIIQTPYGTLREEKPIVEQNGKELEAAWVLNNTYLSFDIKNIDRTKPFIIDPLIRVFGTYYGGSSTDEPSGVNVDLNGNSYLFGETKSNTSLNIATVGSHQTTFGGLAYYGDAFLAKFNSSGVRQWSTYYGGSQGEFANYCALDVNGNVYMVGGTSSTNSAVIATPGSHQSVAAGSIPNSTYGTNDAFLVKFNSSGMRLWGTYYGGSSYEWAYWATVSVTGDIYVSGATHSSDGTSMATTGSHQTSYGGGTTDAFLVKFNSLGIRQWATYYGGSSSIQEDGTWCAVDQWGDVYLCGNSSSTNAISSGSAHQTNCGGSNDAFLVKFNSSGSRQWATYYGGTGNEGYTNGTLDAFGNIYLSGSTNSSTGTIIATSGSHQSTLGGSIDAFFVKFDPAGIRQWGTYYGGSGNDYSGFPSVDSSGAVFFAGYTSTNSGTNIASDCSYQSVYGGGSYDAFLTKFTLGGTRLWGTYYGGSFNDFAATCKADLNGNIYLSGTTYDNTGTVMVSITGHQTVFGGGSDDCFFAKFDRCIPTSPVYSTPSSDLTVCSGSTAVLNASLTCGALWYSQATGNNLISSNNPFLTGNLYSDTTFYLAETSCGSESPRTAVQVTISPLTLISIVPSNTPGCVGEKISLTAFGGLTYTWIPGPYVSSSIQITLYPQISNYIVTGIDQNGCKSTSSISVNPDLCTTLTEKENKNIKPLVYPNPTTGKLNVLIESGPSITLNLVDVTGKEMVVTIYNEDQNKYTIDMTCLSPGIYFLKAQTSDAYEVIKVMKE